MALSRLISASVEGINGRLVEVEVDVATGLPAFLLVGLADKAIDESRERVRSALKHTGYRFPLSRITVHLAPSDTKKTGLHFDLPIALGILVSDEQLELGSEFNKTMFLGGLTLDGRIQPISGSLIMVEAAKKLGLDRVILPSANFFEAKLINGIELIPVSHLTEVIAFISGDKKVNYPESPPKEAINDDETWLEIRGQLAAKRSAIISSTGGHNLLLQGPPGAGKTLLARAIRSLLPKLDTDELIEVVKLQSLGSQIKPFQNVDSIQRPFRSPHHTSSEAAIVGGGSNPRPGEISLSHRGILFLDEIPEFSRSVIESLRQPLEDGLINVSRVNQAVTYPADFILVATMNPCPCGWYGSKQKECTCSAHQIESYQKKISGPILDRIDLNVTMSAVPISDLQGASGEKSSLTAVKQLIKAKRDLQKKRNGGLLNSQLNTKQLNRICVLDDEAKKLIEEASKRLVISARGYHRLLRVARTLADLGGKEVIGSKEIAEAIQYRFSAEH